MVNYTLPRSFHFGMLALIASGALGMAGDLWVTELCLQKAGRQVEAVVTEKRLRQGKGTSYLIDYHFTAPPGTASAGKEIISRENVTRRLYEAVAIGGTVTAYVCPGTPRRHHIDPEMQHRNLLLSLFFCFLVALILTGMVAFERITASREAPGPELDDRGWADPLANGRGGRHGRFR